MCDTPRPPIEQHVTFLYTDRLDATARFYEDVLGLELALDQGACRIYRVCPGAFVGFCTRDAGPAPDGVIVTLISQDVHGWAEALRARGVALEKPPQVNPKYNIEHLFVRDPNGYLVEIQRFLDPAWPQG